ncbi:electron transfer flavoprotein subunit alpha/FixB family protein [Rarobacter faecitabidus]|uniref:Electron transfer flavoprotein alpha subunit apoprotein n=1 Tax=Rarobacter faecitabidus TaxID=13243 RepID=A0A542ZX46_RARFA|nr:electron transfer flavoprotein subunit alpha/FixB family protein [Rarobacter faecitabidus]TQL64869.1 electron transfer flavoprotein alpha subunit apoprotein [Rarobacter faecitabidus]
MTSQHTVAVLIDHADGPLHSPVRELLTIARELGHPVAVSFTPVSDEARRDLSTLGAEELVIVQLDASHHLTPVAAEGLAAAVTDIGADIVLASTTFENREIVALAARQLGAGLVADARPELTTDGKIVAFKRVFAGTWDVWAEFSTGIAFFTVRANTVQASEIDPVQFAERTIQVASSSRAKAARLEAREYHPGHGEAGPALAEAAYVVAGGRGTLGDFEPVHDLADALGGAVGATRDAVDEGWVDHDAQIGQTGVTVAPRVYIGAGISGAPHHRGGMQASQTIIAVNTDPETPLFEIADFAVVGDLADVLPQAARAIREYRTRK